uniref:Odorant receptor n=1 Tax=Lutzomyia longipalpis TaxID=7200 RepID=A0A240SXY8_LUTLO
MSAVAHEKLKKYIIFYFKVNKTEFVPPTRYSVINKGKKFLLPFLHGLMVVFSVWHLLFQMKSLENILELTFSINFTIAGIQTIVTIFTFNEFSSKKLMKTLKYFDNIIVSKEDFIAKTRRIYLRKNLKLAWIFVRLIIYGLGFGCLIFPTVGLFQTNFTLPMYYSIPGIPASSIFYKPVNCFGQYFLFHILCLSIVSVDAFILIFIFYFRGEFYSIISVATHLSDETTIQANAVKILRTIYKAHRNILQEFFAIYDVLWHFYCQKFFGICLYLCSSLFIFSKLTNSIIVGIFLIAVVLVQLVVLSLPGQLIENCSNEFQQTLYMSLWYKMPIRDQKNFLFLMVGAQRQIQARTLGIGKVSVYTLVQVIKTAISYAAFMFAVLL